jgi:hypothetical protein
MRRLNFGISAAGIFCTLTEAIFAHRRIERKFPASPKHASQVEQASLAAEK